MKKEDSAEETGLVSHYDAFKGFGFIRRRKGRDVFFFYDEIEDDSKELSIGDTVSFIVKVQPKGPRAYRIRRLNPY